MTKLGLNRADSAKATLKQKRYLREQTTTVSLYGSS